MLRRLATSLIRLYRLGISPFLGQNCRFYPSCSHYTEEAIARHGIGKGIYLGAKRLGRCHPFTEGGYDPVPDAATPTRCHHTTHSQQAR